VDSLRKDDWVALMLYDRNPHIQQDFTQNKAEFYASLNSVGIPLSSEVDMVDALYDTLDRLQGPQRRKYIVLIGTGRDTFSKKTFDQVLNKLEFAQDTIIYSLDSAHELPGHLARDNMMRAFAKLSGGKLFCSLATGITEMLSQTWDARSATAICFRTIPRTTNKTVRGTRSSWKS
jgi:hypothetical protein